MEGRSFFREVDIDGSANTSVQLADMLSVATDFSTIEAAAPLCCGDSDEPFARGCYQARTIRPYFQCINCDLEIVSPRSVRAVYDPSLCIGLLLKGRELNYVNGNLYALNTVDVPYTQGASEPFEVTKHSHAGHLCKIVALYIHQNFFDLLNEQSDESICGLAELLRLEFQQKEFPSCDILRRIMHKLYHNPYHGVMARLYAESLALSAVVELSHHLKATSRPALPPRTYDNLAHEARAILDRDICAPLSVRDLARQVGLSETMLRRLFKANFGTTILDYIRDQRLDAARILLMQRRFQVAEVAYRIGYSNPANFTNAYKRRYGYPPTVEMERFKQ